MIGFIGLEYGTQAEDAFFGVPVSPIPSRVGALPALFLSICLTEAFICEERIRNLLAGPWSSWL